MSEKASNRSKQHILTIEIRDEMKEELDGRNVLCRDHPEHTGVDAEALVIRVLD